MAMKSVALYWSFFISLRLNQVAWISDIAFERSLSDSVRFLLVGNTAKDSTQINSVHKAELMIYEFVTWNTGKYPFLVLSSVHIKHSSGQKETLLKNTKSSRCQEDQQCKVLFFISILPFP